MRKSMHAWLNGAYTVFFQSFHVNWHWTSLNQEAWGHFVEKNRLRATAIKISPVVRAFVLFKVAQGKKKKKKLSPNLVLCRFGDWINIFFSKTTWAPNWQSWHRTFLIQVPTTCAPRTCILYTSHNVPQTFLLDQLDLAWANQPEPRTACIEESLRSVYY